MKGLDGRWRQSARSILIQDGELLGKFQQSSPESEEQGIPVDATTQALGELDADEDFPSREAPALEICDTAHAKIVQSARPRARRA